MSEKQDYEHTGQYMAEDSRELGRKLRKALVIILLALATGTLGFYTLLTNLSLLESFYLTVATLSSVGYGDISPISHCSDQNRNAAMIFATCLIVFGISGFLYALGAVTEYLISSHHRQNRLRKRMQAKIAELGEHFIICGAGETGLWVARELASVKRKFLVIDRSPEALERMNQEIPDLLYICGNITDDHIFEQAGLRKTSGIAIVVPDEKDALYATIRLKIFFEDTGVRCPLIVKCTSRDMAQKLTHVGADTVVLPTYNSASRMVAEMFNPTAADFLERITREKGQVVRFDEAGLREGCMLVGKSLRDCGIRERTGLNISAIRPAGSNEFVMSPPPEYALKAGDVLLTLGNEEKIALLRRMAGNE